MSEEEKEVVGAEIRMIPKKYPTRVKKYNLVYKTTNLVNGKIYIGVHSTNDKEDGYIGNGIYSQVRADNSTSQVPFVRAVRKHGYSNFKREILYEFGSAELAYWWESYMVDEDFINRDDNYNSVVGGKSGTGRLSKKSLHKMSNSLKGRDTWNKRQVLCVNTGVVYPSTEDASRATGAYNIRAVASGKRKFAGVLNGEQLKWEYVKIEKPTKKVKIINISTCPEVFSRRRVQCINTGEIFDCVTDASLKYNVDLSGICRCANGKTLSAGKFNNGEKIKWRHLEDSSKTNIRSGSENPSSKKVKCINTGRIFNSIKEAEKELGINNINISLKNPKRHAGKAEDGTRLSWVYV